MYWNSEIQVIVTGTGISWIVTLDVLKWYTNTAVITPGKSWIVTLDVLKWLRSFYRNIWYLLNSNIRCIEIKSLKGDTNAATGWIVTLDVLKFA